MFSSLGRCLVSWQRFIYNLALPLGILAIVRTALRTVSLKYIVMHKKDATLSRNYVMKTQTVLALISVIILGKTTNSLILLKETSVHSHYSTFINGKWY